MEQVNRGRPGHWVREDRRRLAALEGTGNEPWSAADRAELQRLRRQVAEQTKDIAFLEKQPLVSLRPNNTLAGGGRTGVGRGGAQDADRAEISTG
jgi:hypothetical protein